MCDSKSTLRGKSTSQFFGGVLLFVVVWFGKMYFFNEVISPFFSFCESVGFGFVFFLFVCLFVFVCFLRGFFVCLLLFFWLSWLVG